MEEQNTNVETEEKQRKPFKRFIGLGVAIVAVVAVGLFIHDALMYESTDDAYVETTTAASVRSTPIVPAVKRYLRLFLFV